MGAGALGWALGAGLGVQARRQQEWQQALGRAGTALACADGRGARGRARGARTGAQGAAGVARDRKGTDARGRAAGACTRGRRARGRARQERAAGRRGASEVHGVGARPDVPGRAWCTGWASLGLMQPV